VIHLETSHTVNTSADFPDDFKVLNGDGVTIVKNPATNEVVLQVPSATTIVYKRPNPEPPIPAAMQADEGGA